MDDMTSTSDLGGLTRVSRDLNETIRAMGGSEAIPSLDQVVKVGLGTVRSADSVSMTRLHKGNFTTPAATDDLSRDGDALQYSLGSGPCIDAVLDETIYHPSDLAHDTRWPVYGQRVSHELGVHSMLSYRIYVESDDAINGLNFYARAPHAFDEDDLVRGLLVATQAALALAQTKAHHLARALETSRGIGAATGILMASDKITFDEAFDLLRVASQHSNRPLRQIAEDVVETGTLDIPHPTSS